MKKRGCWNTFQFYFCEGEVRKRALAKSLESGRLRSIRGKKLDYTEAEICSDLLDDIRRHTARLSGVCRDQSVLAHGIDQTRNSPRVPMYPYDCLSREKYGGIGVRTSELQTTLDIASCFL
jgi:hypothetical protein